MKKTLILLLLLPLLPLWIAAQPPADTEPAMMKRLLLADKLVLANDREQAYTIYMDCAEQGNAYAANAVGIMKQRGWGTPEDPKGSVNYFEKAAAGGYQKAMMNLANIYMEAIGVEQNYEQANYWLEKLDRLNHPSAAYHLGYNCYKGLGTEQNYEKAMEYFQKASDRGHLSAAYFLGLQYRNGYGVERNPGEANYYLSKAIQRGSAVAEREHGEEAPENPVAPTPLKLQWNTNIGKFREVKQQNHNNLSGIYTGSILTYDYSRQHVIGETVIRVSIEQKGDRISGRWVEDLPPTPDQGGGEVKGKLSELANSSGIVGSPPSGELEGAFFSDSLLLFENTSYSRTDRYNPDTPVLWDFKKAVLKTSEIEGEIILDGSLHLYSPRFKEPNKPTFFTLKRVAGTGSSPSLVGRGTGGEVKKKVFKALTLTAQAVRVF